MMNIQHQQQQQQLQYYCHHNKNTNLIDYLYNFSVNNHISKLIRCLSNNWQLDDLPLSYTKEFLFNFNKLIDFLKKDNLTYYYEFLEFIQCQDKELQPGEFYSSLHIGLRFISLHKNSNEDWCFDDIHIIALKWEISFMDEKEGEGLEFNSYELNTKCRVTSEFVSYDNFFHEIEENLCKNDEFVQKCYNDYKLNLLLNDNKSTL